MTINTGKTFELNKLLWLCRQPQECRLMSDFCRSGVRIAHSHKFIQTTQPRMTLGRGVARRLISALNLSTRSRAYQ